VTDLHVNLLNLHAASTSQTEVTLTSSPHINLLACSIAISQTQLEGVGPGGVVVRGGGARHADEMVNNICVVHVPKEPRRTAVFRARPKAHILDVSSKSFFVELNVCVCALTRV
jgi:hypothetical protein